MNDFFVLRQLDRIQKVFRLAGADYDIMRSILQVKLTMDGRRTPTVFAGTKTDTVKEDGSPFRIQWLYLIMGLMLCIFIVPSTDHFMMQLSVMFGIMMFMITTTLVSDFSSVMLDIKDKHILSSKPVNRVTLNMAKSLHILIYLFMLTLPLAGPSLIISLFKYGVLFFLLYGVEIILMNGFILVFTALLYLLILKLFDGEKLKDIINYVQILLTIGITVGYQLISRLFDFTQLSASFNPAWWQYFLPPVWFASPFEMWFKGGQENDFFIMSLLAFIMPPLLIFSYIKLMPAFERNLQKLSEHGTGGKDSGRLADWTSRAICRNETERLFFRFTWSMMKNERDFKLAVYPTMGLSIALPFIFMFTDGGEGLSAARGSGKYLLIYFCAILLQSVVLMLRYSASYKGAWIYKAIPLPQEAPIYRGMLKAAFVRMVLPLFLVEGALFLALFGMQIAADLIVVLLAFLAYTVVCFLILPKSLPFSERYEAVGKKKYTGQSMVLMFILFGLMGVHYLFALFTAGIYIYMVFLIAANLFLWGVSFSGMNSLQAGRELDRYS